MKLSGLFLRWARSKNSSWRLLQVFAIRFCLAPGRIASAETGQEAWLRYAGLIPQQARNTLGSRLIVRAGDSPVLESAEQELTRGLRVCWAKNFKLAERSS